MRLKPNITLTQRWLRGISGALMIAAGLGIPRLPLAARAALTALGIVGILQAFSGF